MMPINMCNVLNIFGMPRYLHATLYMFNTFTYLCVMFKYICSMFGYMFNVRIYMFDVRGIFVFYVFRLYSMSSGYIQCLPENGIMGNLKASEMTALIGWLLFNMAAPQEHMEDNLLVDFLRSLSNLISDCERKYKSDDVSDGENIVQQLKRSQPIRAVVLGAFKLPIIPFSGRH